jgi:hypothetical protein
MTAIRLVVLAMLVVAGWQAALVCLWAMNQPSDIAVFSGITGLAAIVAFALFAAPGIWNWQRKKEKNS